MLLKYSAGIALCVLHGMAFPMQSSAGDTVTLSGELSIQEYQSFSTLLESKNIATVIFKDCLGGNGLAAFKYAKEIKTRNIATVASGVVASACAFAYLGGKVRTVDPAVDTVIMFHGLFYPSTLMPKGPAENQMLLDIFDQHIGFRFGPTVQKMILNTRKRDEGIYFYSIKSRAGVEDFSLYCDGTAPISFDKCQRLAGITLASEGITTKN
jgi:hypothetical protein